MKTPSKSPCQREPRLTRFIRQVGARDDTPSLVMLIAADADYLQLCRSIVALSPQSNPTLANTLTGACRENGITPVQLKEKLTPAAWALGIVQSVAASSDYYHLLGVGPQADAREIQKAFRRKAVKIHPDANADLTDSSRRFAELNDAYRTLRDPELRHHYKISRHHLLNWRERPAWSLRADRSPAIILWYSCGLVVIFILLLLFLDMIVN